MKTIRTILYILLTFWSAACTEFLDVKPLDVVEDDVTIVDKASAETALRGAYRALGSSGYYGGNFLVNALLSGGDFINQTSSLTNEDFIQHALKADNNSLLGAWSSMYRVINRANNVIAKVPEIQDPQLTQAARDQLVGEALFLRALAYFDLVRTWGAVPLILQPTLSAGTNRGIGRTDSKIVYAQIQDDLIRAEQLLPAGAKRIRASKNVVWALLAKYYLYQSKYDLAEEYATKVISDSTNYKLVQTYPAFFADGATNTTESIFEIAHSNTNPNPLRNYFLPNVFGGTRNVAPSNEFADLARDSAVGGGRAALVGQTQQGLIYANLYYRSPAVDPIYVIRIAELYFIRAEARVRQHNLPAALDDLNTIRKRAGLAESTASTAEEILLAIEEEARFEFGVEPYRWYELIRTGRAAEVLNIADSEKFLFPIPQSEIKADPSITQNPGYGS